MARGLVYQPVPTLSLYAQYATGVDPLGTLTTVSTGQVQYSNARGHQVEAGAKWLFANGHGTATLAAYRIVKTGCWPSAHWRARSSRSASARRRAWRRR